MVVSAPDRGRIGGLSRAERFRAKLWRVVPGAFPVWAARRRAAPDVEIQREDGPTQPGSGARPDGYDISGAVRRSLRHWVGARARPEHQAEDRRGVHHDSEV